MFVHESHKISRIMEKAGRYGSEKNRLACEEQDMSSSKPCVPPGKLSARRSLSLLATCITTWHVAIASLATTF